MEKGSGCCTTAIEGTNHLTQVVSRQGTAGFLSLGRGLSHRTAQTAYLGHTENRVCLLIMLFCPLFNLQDVYEATITKKEHLNFSSPFLLPLNIFSGTQGQTGLDRIKGTYFRTHKIRALKDELKRTRETLSHAHVLTCTWIRLNSIHVTTAHVFIR